MNLVGLTNALTDVVVNVTDDELRVLGLKKGGSHGRRILDRPEFVELISRKQKVVTPAGSPANTIFNCTNRNYFSFLSAHLMGTVADDEYGNNFLDYLYRLKINSLLRMTSGRSGICYALISEDGERTFVTDIGVSAQFDYRLEDLQKLMEDKTIFHTSAYEIYGNCNGEILENVKNFGGMVSFDLAAQCEVKAKRQQMEKALKSGLIDILFMNEEEAQELYNGNITENDLRKYCKYIIHKIGSKGLSIISGDNKISVSARELERGMCNTNGAGDGCASGVLYKILNEANLKEVGEFGAFIASLVCQINQAHLVCY